MIFGVRVKNRNTLEDVFYGKLRSLIKLIDFVEAFESTLRILLDMFPEDTHYFSRVLNAFLIATQEYLFFLLLKQLPNGKEACLTLSDRRLNWQKSHEGEYEEECYGSDEGSLFGGCIRFVKAREGGLQRASILHMYRILCLGCFYTL